MTGSDRSALLVMDVQRGVVGRFGDDQAYLERLGAAISAARAVKVPVIYVTVSFRPGHPEISARNRTFAALAGGFAHDDPATEIHPAVAPRPGDIVVTKLRVPLRRLPRCRPRSAPRAHREDLPQAGGCAPDRRLEARVT